jgi:hypothetical protein
VALGTGLRADELRSLTAATFRLDDDPPTIVCDARDTKNGHRAEQPVAGSLAAVLRPWLASRPADRPVFDLTDRAAEMLRVDLQAAGIPYETDAGVVDFQALRVAYISHLVSSGASVKTCQTLARHSTPTLTIGVYARAALHDIFGAVESLPDLTATGPALQAVRATGTDGRSPRTATATATVLPDDETETQAACMVAIGSTEDLKSSALFGHSADGSRFGSRSGGKSVVLLQKP